MLQPTISCGLRGLPLQEEGPSQQAVTVPESLTLYIMKGNLPNPSHSCRGHDETDNGKEMEFQYDDFFNNSTRYITEEIVLS